MRSVYYFESFVNHDPSRAHSLSLSLSRPLARARPRSRDPVYFGESKSFFDAPCKERGKRSLSLSFSRRPLAAVIGKAVHYACRGRRVNAHGGRRPSVRNIFLLRSCPPPVRTRGQRRERAAEGGRERERDRVGKSIYKERGCSTRRPRPCRGRVYDDNLSE